MRASRLISLPTLLQTRGRMTARDLVRPAVPRAAGATAEPSDRRGWTRVTVPVESPGHALAEFLRFGADLEVLAPAEPRDLVAETARAVAEIYDGPGTE